MQPGILSLCFLLASVMASIGGEVHSVMGPNMQDVDLAVAYYPYHGKLRVRVSFSELGVAKAVKKFNLVLKREGDTGKILATSVPALKEAPKRRGEAKGQGFEYAGEIVFDVPDLKDGTYQCTLTLDGPTGVPAEAFVKTFERKTWEWEHNKIGTSRVVIPPFTPLNVVTEDRKGPRVEAVLRSHAMNAFGLWDQVVSKGEEILAGPIRLEARTARGAVRWKPVTMKFIEKSPDHVGIQASVMSDVMSVQVASDFDYDGMMKVTLDLQPGGTEKVETLDLLIPLKEKAASLMHICGDSIRQNYAGKVPAGNGVVWQSKQGANGKGGDYGNIWGTFLPYVWLGGPERGICWFADTDRDWSLADDKSALDIVRENGAVTLRVHLFNKPAVLDHPRRIVFGLQATPVKPMPAPENGKTWRAWNFYSYTNAVVFSILAQTQIWGGEEADFSVYPRKHDFAIFEEMARGRKARNMHISWVDTSGWLDGYTDQKKRAEYRSDVVSGFSTAGSADYVLPYFNPRGSEDSLLMEESLNYCPRPLLGNEWNEPVPSWQDFALYYLRKMAATEAVDGVYYDNVYAAANYDTISGDAYVRSDGKLQPSMGIFNYRQLMKRTATMFHEMGKKPLIVAHMTNADILPMLSFATFCLDFEDKYGVTDFQDRFSTDFILAESIGLQGGMTPVGLGGMKSDDPKEMIRLSRTFFGVALVHEIKSWGYYDLDELHRANIPLYEFGYGLEDCKVWRYWDDSQPVRIEGGNAKSLVLTRGGKAMVIVTDFGEGGNLTLEVDAKALGVKSPFTAQDAQTKEKLEVTGNRIRLPLKRHDFRMMLIE